MTCLSERIRGLVLWTHFISGGVRLRIPSFNPIVDVPYEAQSISTGAPNMPPKSGPALNLDSELKTGHTGVPKSCRRGLEHKKLAGAPAPTPARQDLIRGAGSPRQSGPGAPARL
jgi:hypothetical protein